MTAERRELLDLIHQAATVPLPAQDCTEQERQAFYGLMRERLAVIKVCTHPDQPYAEPVMRTVLEQSQVTYPTKEQP